MLARLVKIDLQDRKVEDSPAHRRSKLSQFRYNVGVDRASGRPKPLEWVGSSKKFQERVFVLHVFQKKSRSGIATPKSDMDLIRERLKVAAGRAKELKNEQA